MKRKVYKFQLTDKDQTLELLPLGSRVLSAKAQGDTLVVYIQVPVADEGEDDLKTGAIHFYTMNTGEELPDDINDYTFLDSVFLKGTAVWCHVYYKAKE